MILFLVLLGQAIIAFVKWTVIFILLCVALVILCAVVCVRVITATVSHYSAKPVAGAPLPPDELDVRGFR